MNIRFNYNIIIAIMFKSFLFYSEAVLTSRQHLPSLFLRMSATIFIVKKASEILYIIEKASEMLYIIEKASEILYIQQLLTDALLMFELESKNNDR